MECCGYLNTVQPVYVLYLRILYVCNMYSSHVSHPPSWFNDCQITSLGFDTWILGLPSLTLVAIHMELNNITYTASIRFWTIMGQSHEIFCVLFGLKTWIDLSQTRNHSRFKKIFRSFDIILKFKILTLLMLKPRWLIPQSPLVLKFPDSPAGSAPLPSADSSTSMAASERLFYYTDFLWENRMFCVAVSSQTLQRIFIFHTYMYIQNPRD